MRPPSDAAAVPPARPLEPKPDERSNYARALAAARNGEPDEVVRELMESAAAAQDPRAQYALATWYLNGSYGYPVDPRAGVKHLRFAAVQGVREAMFDLAVSFELGTGVRKNARRAFLWYLRAALRGDREAVRHVSNCYASGYGVTSDHRAALAWYELAEALGADEGDAEDYRRWLRTRRGEKQ